MALDSIKGTIKDKMSSAGDILGKVKSQSVDKFLDYVNSINDVLPIIAKTGYTLKGMTIDVSIPPGVSLDFQKTKDVSRKDIEKILEENKGRPVLKLIVDSLVTANEFHKRIKLGSLPFTGILVDVSLPPKVTMKFNKK